MTAGAQQALRRTMEIFSNTTRFALACNQSNKIIEPIQSRCAILRYSKLTDAQVMKRLLELCEMEKVRPLPVYLGVSHKLIPFWLLSHGTLRFGDYVVLLIRFNTTKMD
jgi:DNA polymerase III delta prime subunit